MDIKIDKVIAKNNYILHCEFNNGLEKIYDVKPLIDKYKSFEELNNIELFNKVKVDKWGYGISWNEDIDISVEELWENGEDVCPEELYYNSKEIKI